MMTTSPRWNVLEVRPISPAAPGREARRDNEYERCGTANVFCAVEPKAGRHFTFATTDRSGFEFAQVANHLVMDNLNIHRRKALADVFGPEMAAEPASQGEEKFPAIGFSARNLFADSIWRSGLCI